MKKTLGSIGRKNWIALASALAVAAAITTFTTNSYYQLTLTLVPVWAIMGLAWNILGGYAGLISFGHAAFFGLGAYTVTILFVSFGLTPWLGIPVGALVGALAGLLIGSGTFRLRGHYFSLAMLAYPLALLYVFEWAGWQEVALPMQRDSAALYMQFADQRVYAFLGLGLLALALLLSLWVERSRFGLSLMAIKQNELAAEACGIDSFRWKMRAIALSGALAGTAGGFYAVVLLVVTPAAVFGMLSSAQALIVTMFGGVGTAWGPLVGASILIPLSEVLHSELGGWLPGIQGVVLGFALILVVLLMPQGIFWAIRDALARRQAGVAASLNESARSNITPLALPKSARSGKTLLSVSGISKRFGGLQALSKVALEIREGEILGIIGPNGAGKTTLFNVLNGLITPDEGHIELSRQEIKGLKPHQICSLGIARTFQTVRAFPRLTLLENVIVGAFVTHKSDNDAVTAARAALARVNLASREAVTASALTNKELRLLELARALAGSPQLLLLDETFAGLSGPEIDEIVDVIHQVRDEGVTVAVIDHTMQAMVRLADRFVVLDHGKVIAEGDPKSVVQNETVISAYLGRRWLNNAVA